MITDEQAEKAADFIRDNAVKIANAKADRAFYDESLRVVRSTIFLQSKGTVAEREAIALASTEYKDALYKYQAAVRAETELNTYAKAAEMKIEVWRSLQANLRGKI